MASAARAPGVAAASPEAMSDVDVVWMSDPSQLLSGALPGFEDLAHADILASTDCLDPALDLRDHGCFHVLQDRNTGVLLVRNTTNARATMLEWKARTAGAVGCCGGGAGAAAVGASRL